MSSVTRTAKPASLALQLPGELSDEQLDGVSGGLSIAPEKFEAGQYDSGDISPDAVGAGAVESVIVVESNADATVSADIAVARVASIGVTVESKDEPGEYEGSVDAVARHAPEFENTGETGILLGTTTQDGTTTVTAGFTIGETEVSDAGSGVTLTTKYTVAAIAQAYTTQTSAGAGVMAGFGGSASFDLGKGVTFEASGEAVAKAGVGAGIVGNNLVIEGGVSATASVTAEIAAQSEALDEAGTTVRGDTSATAGVEAVASAEGLIGANGVSGDYGASVGFYAKADGEAEFGNDAAAMTVGGGVISPGSVSAGVSGGATMEDGKLTLSIGSEFAVGFGGVSLSLSLEIQLFDGTSTVGTTEEINANAAETIEHMRFYDYVLTEQWRQDLRADVVAADKAAAEAAGQVAAALGEIQAYDRDVKATVAGFTAEQESIDLAREKAMGEPDPAMRARLEGEYDSQEARLKHDVAEWEKRMSSPEETNRRETLFGDLRVAQSKLDVVQGFADGAHERLKFANSITFAQLEVLLRDTREAANDQVIETTKEVAEAGRRVLEFDDAENTDRFNRALEAAATAEKQLTVAQKLVERHDPVLSAMAVHDYTKTLVSDLESRIEALPDSASEVDRRAIMAALDGARIVETLSKDNADRFHEALNNHQDKLNGLNAEWDRLRTEVKNPGLFDEIARLFD